MVACPALVNMCNLSLGPEPCRLTCCTRQCPGGHSASLWPGLLHLCWWGVHSTWDEGNCPLQRVGEACLSDLEAAALPAGRQTENIWRHAEM